MMAEELPCKIAESRLNTLFSQAQMPICSCQKVACMQAVVAWVECKVQALVVVGTWVWVVHSWVAFGVEELHSLVVVWVAYMQALVEVVDCKLVPWWLRHTLDWAH